MQYSYWPPSRLSAKGQAHLELRAEGTDLRPLKCAGWQVVQNLDFNLHRLSTELRSSSSKNADSWKSHFSELSSSDNILAITSKFEVELYRPVCLSLSRHYLTFCFLSHPEA
jgi:hypothetical protein